MTPEEIQAAAEALGRGRAQSADGGVGAVVQAKTRRSFLTALIMVGDAILLEEAEEEVDFGGMSVDIPAQLVGKSICVYRNPESNVVLFLEATNYTATGRMCGSNPERLRLTGFFSACWEEGQEVSAGMWGTLLEISALLAERSDNMWDFLTDFDMCRSPSTMAFELLEKLLQTSGFRYFIMPTATAKEGGKNLKKVLSALKLQVQLLNSRPSGGRAQGGGAEQKEGDTAPLARITFNDEKTSLAVMRADGFIKIGTNMQLVIKTVRLLSEKASAVRKNFAAAFFVGLRAHGISSAPNFDAMAALAGNTAFSQEDTLVLLLKSLGLKTDVSSAEAFQQMVLIDELIEFMVETAGVTIFLPAKGAGRALVSATRLEVGGGGNGIKLRLILAQRIMEVVTAVSAAAATGVTLESVPFSAEYKRFTASYVLAHGEHADYVFDQVAARFPAGPSRFGWSDGEDDARAAAMARYGNGKGGKGYKGGKGVGKGDGKGGKGDGKDMGKGNGGKGGESRVCFGFLRYDFCDHEMRYGNCNFSHFAASGKALCAEYFLQGQCSLGADCWRAHSTNE